MSSSNEVEKSTSLTIEIPKETSVECIGSVKWFNTKSGYGFISVLDGELKGNDIFAHHSAISVSNEQYKYLVQGEYVKVIVQPSDSKDYKWQASSIFGVCDGPLMCETRNQIKATRVEYSRTKKSDEESP
jgi:cold shock CspA family protein